MPLGVEVAVVEASVNLNPLANTRSPLYEVVERNTPLT